MVRATLHTELAPSQRVDVLLSTALLASVAVQYVLSGWTFFTIAIFVVILTGSIALLLAPVYSVNAYRVLRLSRALESPQNASVVLADFHGKRVVRPLEFRKDGETTIPRFEHERRYYEAREDAAAKAVREFDLIRCPAGEPLKVYLQRLTEKDTRNASKLLQFFGVNRFDIPLPDLKRLVIEQAQSPFFLFQVFCVLLWMLDEYWYFAVFTLLMLLMFEYVVAQNRRRNIEVARQMLRPDYFVWVKRAGYWRRIMSSEVVPLDVIAVAKDSQNPFPCDALLVHGSCVVNEAMLTGESTPKMKDSITSDPDIDLSKPLSTTPEDSRFVLLGGTYVLDSRRSATISAEDAQAIDAPESIQAIAVVLRTGYETTQGSLMRVILHAGERVTVDSNREAYAFMGCLVIVATIAAGYVLMVGLKDPNRSHWKLLLHCIMIVTSVVPPELPMELSLAVTTSLSNLIQKHSVYCTEPYRIPLAGMTDVCCFDKTGTLTSDDLNVKQIVDAKGHDASGSREVREILALCQSLVIINGQVQGDTTETAAWRYLGDAFTILKGEDEVGLNKLRGMGSDFAILKRFAFDSTLRRMTVIAAKRSLMRGNRLEATTMNASSTSPDSEMQFVIYSKGAPETLQSLLREVPEGYEQTYRSLAEKGFRVLCLAKKEMPMVQSGLASSIIQLSRSEAESGLEFKGFLALDSPLKADSISVVNELKQSGHRVVIITGDNDATAREVGRRVQVSDGSVITGQQLAELEAQYGSSNKQELIAQVLKGSIFARVSPAQKEKIISLFSDAGLVTMMCGDGTNDAGALKRADVGISVISHPILERIAREEKGASFEQLLDDSSAHIQLGDASIASPFTAKTPHVSAVLDIVRQGRCTLVTTIQMFKILAVNGLIHSITMTVLFLQGVRQGDTQSTIFGLIVAVVFALLSFTQPLQHLTERRPVSRIFSLAVISSILGQSLIHLATLFAVCRLVDPSAQEKIDPDAEFKPNQINTLVYITGFVLQANVFAVNYRGHPFMTPFIENKRFSRMIFLMWVIALVLASGLAPEFVLSMLELVVLPDIHTQLVMFLVADTVATFAWERLLVRGVFGG